MDKVLNIAHCVESYAPLVTGMAEVARRLSEYMVAQGHRVTVFTAQAALRNADNIRGVAIRSYAVTGNRVNGMQGETERYVSDVIRGEFDVIVLFSAQQWATDALLPYLNAITARKIFVPTGFSGLMLPAYAQYFTMMPAWLRQMDCNIFHSRVYRDARFAEAHGITNGVIIPNGASEEEFDNPPEINLRAVMGIRENERIILHVGAYTGMKGHAEAVEIFCRARVPNSVLLMCGSRNLQIRRQLHRYPRLWPMWARLLTHRIIMTEADRPTTLAAFHQSELFLFPSHMECSPVVLFECMAAGLPFLASDAGNAQEIASWCPGSAIIPGTTTDTGRTLPDVKTGASMLREMMHNAGAHHSQMKAARQRWKSEFTWSHIAQRYLDTYLSIIG